MVGETGWKRDQVVSRLGMIRSRSPFEEARIDFIDILTLECAGPFSLRTIKYPFVYTFLPLQLGRLVLLALAIAGENQRD